jgi:hypothetical protein
MPGQYKGERVMHLLKVTISKDSRIHREDMIIALRKHAVCSESQAQDVLPAVRSKTDAVRMAAQYVLLNYQRFDHNARTCKILAKSPRNAKTKRGLDLQLNVQAIGDETVEYSEQILRVYAPNAQSTPEIILQPAASEFTRLVSALDIDTLIYNGQHTLYDNDMRRIIDILLEPYTSNLWKGLSLVIDDTGLTYIERMQALCDTELGAGSITLSTLALDMSHANRVALARELATEEYIPALKILSERCGYAGPNVKAIETAYDALLGKIDQANNVLGVDIPCKDAQIDLETALMSLA